MVAYFNRFTIAMTTAQAQACSHAGACDADIAALIKLKRVSRPTNCTPSALVAELKEYGAWDENELKNDSDNWVRILWLAAGNITEELKQQS
jgi:hypothetical protein